MPIKRLIFVLVLPLADLLIPLIFAEGFGRDVCPSGLCAAIWPILAYAAMIWAAIYLVLFLVALVAVNIPWVLLRAPLLVILGLLVMILVLYSVVSASFVISNGILLNPDAVMFLAMNAIRVPHHLLQTSPFISVAAAIFIFVTTFVAAGTFMNIARRTRLPRALLPVAAAAAAFIATVSVPTPEGAGNLSGPAFANMLLVRINPALNPNRPDPALAETFAPRREYRPAEGYQPKYPVIAILVESFRRDLIEMSPTPIPFLKKLAEEEGIWFDKAYATASHSNYADVAFWFSRYPMRSLSLQEYRRKSPARGMSVFEVMKRHGYATGYISSQNELWGGMINWLKVNSEVDHFYHSEDFDGDTWHNEDDKLGIVRLINKGVATAGKIEDSVTLNLAAKWIDGLGPATPFFLGMNLQNTHFSYVIPPGGPEPYQPAELDFATVYYVWPAKHKEKVRNRYLNAVFNLDRQLSAFADYLKAQGIWDNAMVVIVGDSGEAFHEHGFGNHSGPMYDEVMRTFALVKPPKSLAAPRGIYQPAISHLDITATIPDMLGIPVPTSFQGRSILSESPRPDVFMHTNAVVRQNGMVRWPWKYLRTVFPNDRVELYHLADDPGELNNRAVSDREKAQELAAALDLWINRNLLYYSDPDYLAKFDPPK